MDTETPFAAFWVGRPELMDRNKGEASNILAIALAALGFNAGQKSQTGTRLSPLKKPVCYTPQYRRSPTPLPSRYKR